MCVSSTSRTSNRFCFFLVFFFIFQSVIPNEAIRDSDKAGGTLPRLPAVTQTNLGATTHATLLDSRRHGHAARPRQRGHRPDGAQAIPQSADPRGFWPHPFL